MHEALTLLEELQDDDLRWLLDAGRELTIHVDAAILTEGTDPDCLYIVLSGLVGIRVAAVGETILARLGPGELLGEMSFLEGVPASATAVARGGDDATGDPASRAGGPARVGCGVRGAVLQGAGAACRAPAP